MLVVGSVNRDHVCRVEALPAPGETVLGGEASVGSGGKGGNQAVAASLLGARTALVARVGDDSDGHALTAALAEAGVDTNEVVATDVRTGLAFVFVDAHGENSIVVAPGANALLDPASVDDAVRRRLAPSGVLVTQAEIPVAGLRRSDPDSGGGGLSRRRQPGAVPTGGRGRAGVVRSPGRQRVRR